MKKCKANKGPAGVYLRLGFGGLNERSVGHRYVIEIWPGDQASKVHNHGNADGVIIMMHGEVEIDLYEDVSKQDPI